jgi:protein TonB
MRNKSLFIGILVSFLIHVLILTGISLMKVNFSSLKEEKPFLKLKLISLNFPEKHRKINQVKNQIKGNDRIPKISKIKRRKLIIKKKHKSINLELRRKKEKVGKMENQKVKSKFPKKEQKVRTNLASNLVKKREMEIKRENSLYTKNTKSHKCTSKENFPALKRVTSTLKSKETSLQNKNCSSSQINKQNEEYLSEILNKIEKHKYYPYISRLNGEEGKVKVSFTINEDGTLKNVKILESSGYIHLDRAAVKTVKRASPFPKPPSKREETIDVIINFRLEN